MEMRPNQPQSGTIASLGTGHWQGRRPVSCTGGVGGQAMVTFQAVGTKSGRLQDRRHSDSANVGSRCTWQAMALHFKTSTPKKLLATYKKLIDDGRVKTWSYDSDGDFTHTAEQWSRKAWLRPKIIEREELVFYILSPKESDLSSAVYAVYHGRFVESLLQHCDKLFSEASATAMPEAGDII